MKKKTKNKQTNKTKKQILINKPVYLGLSIQELRKTLMYEFWYDYVKAKYGKKAKLCLKDKHSFIVYIKTDDIYKDIAEDVERRFDMSNYESESNSIERPLPKGKNKKSNWIKERWIRQKKHDKICWIKSKNL